MKELTFEKFVIKIPDEYQPTPLPFFTEWIKALESGEFKQCEGRLLKDGAYCCLGVLSRIQGRLDMTEGSDGIGSGHYSGLALDNPARLVLKGTGDIPSGITVTHDGLMVYTPTLAFLNDHGVSFKDIATLIKNLWKSST